MIERHSMRERLLVFRALALSLILALVAAPAGAKPAATHRSVVSAANPLAVEAGLKVLRAGGGAADAAVAIQAVLGLVEPQSSGLGGGAFLVYYDARTKKVTAYDGREVAPMGASPDMFLRPDGRPLSFGEAVVSGRATGVPGAVAMLAAVQKDHGHLPWARLFEDSAALAEQGFKVSPRLADYIAGGGFPQSNTPDVKRYFAKPDGQTYKAGDTLKNAAYAATLRALAKQGPSAILRGPVAADIVARLHAEPLPATMTEADLAGYQPKVTEPLCRPYRVYIVCTPQPPSGGIGLLEMLGILEATDIAKRGPKDAQAWFLFAEASRLTYADRDHYVGDPAKVAVPISGLLDAKYTASRAKLIGANAIPGAPAFGQPAAAPVRSPDRTLEPAGTSSFAVADKYGNVVAMTTTVESLFGTGRMVHGFFLNNQLTDFSFAPREPSGEAAANAVGPGKRPRSTMSPTIVLDRQGRFVAAIGSPGGAAIIDYVAKTLVALIDWKMPLDQAIALPNLIARGDTVSPEMGFDAGIAGVLRDRGLNVREGRAENSGLHGLAAGSLSPNGALIGAADPRREGVARGF